MKKILGIIGSPRKKGNTDLLVNRILEGAKNKGATPELIYLKDLNIMECDGCHICWKDNRCSKKDDMIQAYQSITDCDMIVFGTPVYWYGPTALMKGFIDRFVYFNCPENRHKIKGKDAVLVIPFEEKNPETAAPVIEFFTRSLNYLEMNIAGKLIVPGVTIMGEVSGKIDLMQEAYKLGKDIIT